MVYFVASFTDAWIETEGKVYDENWNEVASFTDAWIETLFEQCSQQLYRVASFTDAWIETSDEPVISGLSVSHLLQMRGLKQYSYLIQELPLTSHLLQMRGLKLLYREGYRA